MSKWPKKVKHRKQVLAKIYRPCEGRDSYRIAWKVGGKRMMKSFATCGGAGGALEHAEELVKDLAKGSRATALTPGQANDALAAIDRLEAYRRSTGRTVSILRAVSAFCDAEGKLQGGYSLGEAVDGFLSTVVSVKRIDIAEAIEQFIEERAKKTKPAKPGKRPALSAGYHYIVCMWLREFAKTLPNTAVCDLTKDLLNAYISQHGDVSERTRNGRRTVLGMFLKWCVCRDYLAAGHRLLEATGMKQEDYDPEEIDFYRPVELAGLLQAASNQAEYRPMLPVIALCGLAGLRLQEAVRLTYEDVFRVEGYIEISRTKGKARSRRLVKVESVLAQWLAPYRDYSGLIWKHGLDKFHADFGSLRTPLKIPARRNGLRHAWVTYHLAKHKNENLTAAEAGNTPAMIHSHYNGLATPEEAAKWFSIGPEQPGNVLPLASAIAVAKA